MKNTIDASTIAVDVSCADCVRHSTSDCDDCLVSYVLGDTPQHLTLSRRMADVAALLHDGGLLPELRFTPSDEADPH